jgi:hypothetical protein
MPPGAQHSAAEILEQLKEIIEQQLQVIERHIVLNRTPAPRFKFETCCWPGRQAVVQSTLQAYAAESRVHLIQQQADIA